MGKRTELGLYPKRHRPVVDQADLHVGTKGPGLDQGVSEPGLGDQTVEQLGPEPGRRGRAGLDDVQWRQRDRI